MPSRHLDQAVGALDGATGKDAGRLRIRVLITRSWTELEVNGLGPALAMLSDARERAAAIDDRLLVALSHIQEGVIHVRGGDWAASLTALDGVGDDEQALDPSQRCALLINRGLAHLGLGHSTQAEVDLTRAAEIAAANGFADQEFKARHNLACLAFVDGDLARALVLMRTADRMDAAVSRDRARLDHAEVLLEAGLVDKARSVLDDALESARADDHRLEVGEISARLARCDLLVDDLEGARRHIRTALAAYRTRQVEELVRDAALIRSTIDVAAGHDLGAVITDLARRNAQAATSTVTERAAVRLEAEARLLLGRRRRRRAAAVHARAHATATRSRPGSTRRSCEPASTTPAAGTWRPSAASPPATGCWRRTSSSPRASTCEPPWPCTADGSPPSTSSVRSRARTPTASSPASSGGARSRTGSTR